MLLATHLFLYMFLRNTNHKVHNEINNGVGNWHFFLIKLWLDLLQNILLIILILMVTLLTKEDHQNVTISKDLEQELKLLKSYFSLSMSIIVQIRYFSEKSRKTSNVLSPYWRVSLNWNRNHYLLIIIQQVLSYY